jgi:hypothetical protein
MEPGLNCSWLISTNNYSHAGENLSLLSAILHGEGTKLAKRRYRLWKKWLLKDKAAEVVQQAKQDLPQQAVARKLAQLQINYLDRNRSKMLRRHASGIGDSWPTGWVVAPLFSIYHA